VIPCTNTSVQAPCPHSPVNISVSVTKGTSTLTSTEISQPRTAHKVEEGVSRLPPSSTEISLPAEPTQHPKTSLLTMSKCAGTHSCQHETAPKAHPKPASKQTQNHKQSTEHKPIRSAQTPKKFSLRILTLSI
jgi:hypothetical protein